MANQLTGGFDVVAEFSLGAVNRVLAAMHRGGRLQHSLSVRVDNTPRSLGTFGVVTEFGEALTSRMAVSQGTRGTTGAATSSTAVARLLTQVLDPLINVGTIFIPPPVAHPLHGVAQLQLGSPTISLPTNKHNQATVHIPLMAQYFPDQNSTVLPRFLAGELQITFAATHVNSNAGKFIHIDLPSIAGISTGSIHFQPSQALDQDSIATIDAALRHAVSTAFEPSNTAIPSSLTDLQIFTLPQQGAVAVLMNLPGGQLPVSPTNFNSVFLNPSDQFALAISSEFLTSAILDPINQSLQQNSHQHFSYSIDWLVTTSHYDVNIDINSVTLEFQDGRILVTLKVHIDAEVPGPDQSDTITAKQAFTLNLNNGVVTLVRLGDVDVDNSSIIFQIVDSLFGSIKSRVRNAFLSAWNSHQAEIQSKVRSKLSSSILQGFVQKLMNPVTAQTPPPEIVNPTLAFTSIEIRKAGVVVHGSLAVPPWPAPNVEFDLIPNTATMQHPEYNALKSWIPGGTIKDYVWSYSGQARPADATKFLSTDAPSISAFAAFGGVCVKAEGTRISPSGPVVMQPVSLRVCHGILSGNAVIKIGQQPLPDLAVTNNSKGQIVINGHVSPWSPAGARTGTVNLLVHFPSDKSISRLAELPRLVQSAKRPDADTAIVGVLTAAQIPKAKDPGGMAFADDAEGWEKLLGVKQRPATVLLGPDGDVLWRYDGDLDGKEVAANLNKHLSARSYFTPRLLRMPLKQGLRAPNFVFDYSEGRQITLRKLAGRRVVLIFCKSSSKPSMDTVALIEKTLTKEGSGVAVLAIDGSSGDSKKARASSTKSSSLTIIADPQHKISDAYGVSVWPTTIMLDEEGLMQEIRYGLLTAKDLGAPAGSE